jgi:hypothetical protein
MIDNRPTEILGESINHWDQFYANHYEWLLSTTLMVEGTEAKAKELTQRVLTKLFLSHPEAVINSSKESLCIELGILCPNLKHLLVHENSKTQTKELLQRFYSPN